MCVLRDITKPRNVSDSRHTQPADRQTLANLAPQKFKKLPPPVAHSIPQLKVPANLSLTGNQREECVLVHSSVQNLAIYNVDKLKLTCWTLH